MVWSENARFYAVGAVLASALAYVFYRKDYLGPAILMAGATLCLLIVASPRGR